MLYPHPPSERRHDDSHPSSPADNCRTLDGRTSDIAAQRSGFSSGKQFERAKSVVDNATPELVESGFTRRLFCFGRQASDLDGAVSVHAVDAQLACCCTNTRLRAAFCFWLRFCFRLKRNLRLRPLRPLDPLRKLLIPLKRGQG